MYKHVNDLNQDKFGKYNKTFDLSNWAQLKNVRITVADFDFNNYRYYFSRILSKKKG